MVSSAVERLDLPRSTRRSNPRVAGDTSDTGRKSTRNQRVVEEHRELIDEPVGPYSRLPASIRLELPLTEIDYLVFATRTQRMVKSATKKSFNGRTRKDQIRSGQPADGEFARNR